MVKRQFSKEIVGQHDIIIDLFSLGCWEIKIYEMTVIFECFNMETRYSDEQT